jgi:hypothetical protein
VAGHLGSSILASSYIEGRCQCRGPRRQPNSVSALGPRSRRCRGPPAALSGRNVTRPGPEVDIESLSTRAQPGPAPLRLCLSSNHRPRPEAPAAGRWGGSYPAGGKGPVSAGKKVSLCGKKGQSLREKSSNPAGKKFQPCGKKLAAELPSRRPLRSFPCKNLSPVIFWIVMTISSDECDCAVVG